MDNFRAGRAAVTRRWIAGSIALAAAIGPTLGVVGPATPARAAQAFVQVDDLTFRRDTDRAVVSAQVRWNSNGVSAHRMTVGDLRLVAVDDRTHLPVVLGTKTQDVSDDQTRTVRFVVDDARGLAAMRTGNRIVLTASQHQPAAQVSRSVRTYVTVAQVQPHGSRQPHIGTEDCADRAIVPGAALRYCDLVGAYLDGALVSIHDPNSDEGRVPSQSTRMERADLTGATAVRSDFSGASIAGGRLNGLDLRDAKLDNLSLAGAEAVEIDARRATSDKDARDSGANLFRTDLRRADLRDTVFRGISVGRARLDGAQLQGAYWESFADGATFRGADLRSAVLGASRTEFVDFTDADLRGSTLNDLQLAWTWLCRTALPTGSLLDGSRDCRTAVEAPRIPVDAPDQATPYVTIGDAGLDDGPGPRAVRASIQWDVEAADPAGYAMAVGDLRLVAVDRATGVPTLLDSRTVDDLAGPTDYEVTITRADALAAMASGNRVVLTATQHPPRARSGKTTARSYVTVAVLQRGPGLGRIGRLDCSRVALTATSPRALDFCDLTGAMLDTAALAGRSMREADLTGATMRDGLLTGLFWDGARLAGLNAERATVSNISAFDSWAPRLDLSGASVVGSPLNPRNLDDADFRGSKLTDSPLVATSLRRANFTGARLIHPDLAYTDLRSARFADVDASRSNPSLFLANLSRADLTGSTWNVDEGGEEPWRWSTLCRTKLPAAEREISGDRDCPR